MPEGADHDQEFDPEPPAPQLWQKANPPRAASEDDRTVTAAVEHHPCIR